MNLEGLDHVALIVTDLERSRNWYRDVLGLERRYEEMWGDVPTFLSKGSTGIALFPAKIPSPGPPPERGSAIVMSHVAFRADRENFLQAQHELKRRGIAFEFQDHGIAHSIYFSDPDGHRLEITTYEV